VRPPLHGRVLLTGASAGIGAAMAPLLARQAALLLLVARRRERLDALAAQLTAAYPACRVEVWPCDLSDLAATAALAAQLEARHGGVDVLINNAGLGDAGLLHQRDPGKLLRMLQVNVLAPVLLTRRLAEGMAARGAGGVLNVSSGLGLFWLPGFATYAASKHFVTAWSEALALELAPHGVVVSQLLPGPVATEFEDIAANPTGERLPAWLNQPAERCARRALAAFASGRRWIVPSFGLRLLYALGGLAPRWLRRIALRPMVGRLRAPPAD
jgi:short-subunit dehydrogenase